MYHRVREQCGVFVANSLHDLFGGLEGVQHRGREAVGIGLKGDTLDIIKWEGKVNYFTPEEIQLIVDKELGGRKYHTHFGHVRYATRGNEDTILHDAHPVAIGGKVKKKGIFRKTITDEYTNLPKEIEIKYVVYSNCDKFLIHNGQCNDERIPEIDHSRLQTRVDSEKVLHVYDRYDEYKILTDIPGCYTLAIADKDRDHTIIMRDPLGNRIGVLGEKNGIVIGSETAALVDIGAHFIEDLDRGSLYRIYDNGKWTKEHVRDLPRALCHFEFTYLARPDSVIDGISVLWARKNHARHRLKEIPPEILKQIDYISWIPNTPRPYAEELSKLTGIPLIEFLRKVNGNRSFLGSNTQMRRECILGNMHLVEENRHLLKGRNIWLGEDSIIRGNCSTAAKSLIIDIGQALKAWLDSYEPMIGKNASGCRGGVDMPPDDNFVARGRTLEEITALLEIPVGYMSIDSMFSSFEDFGIKRDELCAACNGLPEPY